MKSAAVHSSIDQPGSTAIASASGKIAEMTGPMKGTKRSTSAIKRPKRGVGHADDPKADPNRDRVGHVHHQLHQQVLSYPLACVLDGFGGAVDVASTDEADEAVPQILALQQHEDNHYDDDSACRQRLKQRSYDGL